MILVISKATDEHAQAVLSELARLNAPATLLDLSQFPQEMALAMSYSGPCARDFSLSLPDHSRLNLAECRSMWWRRPQQFVVHPDIPRSSHQIFAYNECIAAFSGLWQASDAFWVNHPTRDEVAAHKSYQLRVAQDVGLTIPATLITNDPISAQEFILAQGRESVIYKTFSATAEEWRETRLLGDKELSLLGNVKYAPVIFQEYIRAQVDLRVTVVGDDIFAAAIHSQETSYKVDFRMDMMRARLEPHLLPQDVAAAILELMRKLGLIYGAIDMRLTPSGQYVFLEINPAGQWLFVEARTGQEISASLARMLAENDKT